LDKWRITAYFHEVAEGYFAFSICILYSVLTHLYEEEQGAERSQVHKSNTPISPEIYPLPPGLTQPPSQ